MKGEEGVVGEGEWRRYISAMQNAPNFSSAQMLNSAQPQLLPPSHFEVFQQSDQTTFLPAHDFQLGYVPRLSTPTTFQHLELPKWDSFCSNTCISDCVVKDEPQPVLQQQHLDESCVEQEGYCYAGLDRENRHQILERTSPGEIYGQPARHDSCYKMQCMDQIRDAQWQLMYEYFVNDCQDSPSCLTPQGFSSAPTLPSDSHFSPTCTGVVSRNGKRQEEIVISPCCLPAQSPVYNHEMMMSSLPEKGKLLEAVVKAGPLLQTLLVAGPLPLWQRPPPEVDSSQIPLVPIQPTSPPGHPTAFAHKQFSQEVKYAHKKDESIMPGQSFPYSPSPLIPRSSSFKKRFMFMQDENLHNAISPLKHAKLQ